MAKGDHSRAQNKIDEQQQMGQSYLTQTQANIGQNYGQNYANYWGAPNPTAGGIVSNYGSTVPSYSQYGQNPFEGNKTGNTITLNNQGNNTYGMGPGSYDPQTVGQMALEHARSLGGANDANLAATVQWMQSQGIPVTANPGSDGFWLDTPNGRVGADIINGYKSGNGVWQNPIWDGYGGGGGLGSSYPGMSGVPGGALGDYSQIASLYAGMLPQYRNLYGDLRGQYGSFLGSASNMANTGGLSDTDKAAIRSRAISPIRSVYSQGLQNLSRQKALQGGYSPGYTTALGRFNRDMGQQTSDATTNAEAAIAELVQKGKLGGLGAWGSGLSGMGSGLLGALGGMNQSIGGMSGLYGQTPGLANFYAGQLNNNIQQQLAAAGLQNGLSDSIMKNQIASSQIPGNWMSAMQNIYGLGAAGGAVGGAIYPWTV